MPMNNAIRQYRPASNWISVALLSLFVVSFAMVAQSHVRDNQSAMVSSDLSTFCSKSSQRNAKVLFRYH